MNASLESPASTAALATLKRRVAGWSIVATVIVTALKLTAGLISGSLALLADGAHGLLDIGATTLTFFAVRQADRPPLQAPRRPACVLPRLLPEAAEVGGRYTADRS